MATTASAASQPASTAYSSSLPQHYASNPQGYQQAAAYSYPAWPAQQPTYDPAQAYAAQPGSGNPPLPGAEPEAVAADSTAGQEQAEEHAAWYSHCQEYNAYYGQYPAPQQYQQWYQWWQQQRQQQQPQQHYGYAAAAPAAQAWAPSAPQQPNIAPTQHATAAAAPARPATNLAHAGQAASHKAAPVANAGYKWSNGRYVPVAKAGADAKPHEVKFTMAKKKPVVVKPAYTQVADAKQAESTAEPDSNNRYPPSLNAYVRRCFNNAGTQQLKISVDAMKVQLKQMISESEAKGEMWTRDWDKVPVPGDEPTAAVAVPFARPSKWGQQAKPVKQSPAPRPASPSSSLSSRSTRRSYSSDSSSRSRSSGSASSLRSRSRSFSRSPSSLYRGAKGGTARKRTNPMKGSPEGAQGRAKKMKQAGPPETKKQRKQRLQQERKAAQQAAVFAKKAKKQQKAQQSDDGPPLTPEEVHRRNMRAGRFGSGAVDHSGPAHAHAPVYAAALSDRGRDMEVGDGEGTWDQHAVQGTCSNLEKKYFRLTGPPDPQAVRPPSVLQAALDRVVRVYRAGQCDMHYAEDQLKAMRQDVTVQHVRGALPVRIYEAHARACLEHGNGGDFNQCQAQLTVLYEEGSPGCVQEFVAYRVLYQSIFRSKESASLLATLEQLSPQVCAQPAVAHALKVRQALVFSRFTTFFHLYACAPNLGRAVMDMCFTRVRFAALETLAEAFKNTKVKVVYVASVLGFLVKPHAEADRQGQQGVQPSPLTQGVHDGEVQHKGRSEGAGSVVLPGCARPAYPGKHPAEVDCERAAAAAVRWLRSCNAVVLLEQGAQPSTALLDCKPSVRLSMPEDVTAVAHGDATLNLHSFMHHVRVT